MKKQIAFTAEEKLLLSELLANRLARVLSSGFINAWLPALETALAKMLQEGNQVFSDKEITMCNSCVNEALDIARPAVIKRKLSCWLDVTGQQKELMERIDRCNDILLKCKPRKEEVADLKSFRYREIFSCINQLRLAEIIALTWDTPGEFDKIAFISPDEEIAEFRLKHSYTGRDLKFYRYRVSLPRYLAERFTVVVDKPAASKLIGTSPKSYYPEDTITFFNAVLR